MGRVMTRVFNFNAGPAVLPEPVLQQARAELPEYPGAGMSVLEMSHRSPQFAKIRDEAEAGLRALLGIPDNYHVLFLQGGASLQFSMLPLNLLSGGGQADYLLSGSWGKKALQEAQKVGDARSAASTQEGGFRRVPRDDELQLRTGATYVHFTTNETIGGVQWPREPQTNGVLLAADASSDILSRPLPIEKYGILYAGAQKNMGPAGVTLVIIRDDWVREPPPELATMLAYRTHASTQSLYNTPNTFGIYIMGLVAKWLRENGGLEAMQRRNEEKARLLYDELDAGDFYRGHAEKESRSRMNVTFRLPDEALEEQFVREAEARGLAGLKGHRSVGGVRASIYNAMPLAGVQVLAEFMREFAAQHQETES
jgi:phosphoserine aminotransferase